MSLKDIKTKNKGFTIVELLIVVVVIAILAAITIVSYNGITNQANASAADSLVATWRKKIELYHASEGAYPFEVEQLGTSGDAFYMPSTSLVTANPSSTNGTQSVWVQACGIGSAVAPTADAAVGGITITYYDYEAGSVATPVQVGNPGTNCANF